MCQKANNKNATVSKDSRQKFGIYTDQEGSDSYLQPSDSFSSAIKIRF